MRPSGPVPARIMIVGEFPTTLDLARGYPFSDSIGDVLDSVLQKIGVTRSSCFITNLLPVIPPGQNLDEWVSGRKTPPSHEWTFHNGKWVHPSVAKGLEVLKAQIEEVNPSIIIPLGSGPLWALTGETAIQKWRGSRMSYQGRCVLPTLHPMSAFKDFSLKPILLNDFHRAKALLEGRQHPREYDFIINPTFQQTIDYLNNLIQIADQSQNRIKLSGDLETRLGHIACFGIATSETHAFCIPFLELNEVNPFYWPADEEAEITLLLIKLLSHRNIEWIGQNFLYDCQYFHRFWGVIPPFVFDTMIGHHSIFSNTRKGLDFLSSLYAHDHVYWKGEIKDWEPGVGEKQFWTYNCKDACITFEVAEKIKAEALQSASPSHCEFQQALFHPVLRMMNRGLRVDTTNRHALRLELQKAYSDRLEKLEYMVGHEINPRSSAQLIKFFYHDMKIPGIRSMISDSLTLNSPALAQIAQKHPVLSPLCQAIAELRSISVFLSTFVNAPLDSDDRMRCSFSVAGPTTFRFSSSENAFGSGMNLQNIPVAEKAKIKSKDYIHLPNIRKLFIPDPGYTFFDMDLDRADLQVVVWEADDSDMKKVLRSGLDMHLVNACDIFDLKGIPYDELAESHPNYREHRARIGEPHRNKAKMGVHATNYGVGDYKLAQALGITVREASLFRSRWFGVHPGIRQWHLRVEKDAASRGFVENKFGARLNVLGRFDLPECLAWIPQSTVARIINTALYNIDEAEQRGFTSIQLLLQVHDSLAGQFLTARKDEEVNNLLTLSRVEVPYPDPLIIPVGINLSTQSWGHTKD